MKGIKLHLKKDKLILDQTMFVHFLWKKRQFLHLLTVSQESSTKSNRHLEKTNKFTYIKRARYVTQLKKNFNCFCFPPSHKNHVLSHFLIYKKSNICYTSQEKTIYITHLEK